MDSAVFRDRPNDQGIRHARLLQRIPYCIFAILAFFAVPLDQLNAELVKTCKQPADKTRIASKDGERSVAAGSFLFKLNGNVIELIDSSGEPIDRISVQQYDAGSIDGLFVDKNGGLLALANETSFRVTVDRSSDPWRFSGRQEFPTLFREICGWTQRYMTTCRFAQTTFSHELKSAFISGYDGAGRHQSYMINSDEFLNINDLTSSPAFHFLEIVGSGSAQFRTVSGENYLFDGETMSPCISK